MIHAPRWLPDYPTGVFIMALPAQELPGSQVGEVPKAWAKSTAPARRRAATRFSRQL